MTYKWRILKQQWLIPLRVTELIQIIFFIIIIIYYYYYSYLFGRKHVHIIIIVVYSVLVKATSSYVEKIALHFTLYDPNERFRQSSWIPFIKNRVQQGRPTQDCLIILHYIINTQSVARFTTARGVLYRSCDSRSH